MGKNKYMNRLLIQKVHSLELCNYIIVVVISFWAQELIVNGIAHHTHLHRIRCWNGKIIEQLASEILTYNQFFER